MSSRHTILQRVAAWTAGVLLLLTAYVLGAHLCYSTIGRRIPASAPIVAGLYAPLSVYSRHPDWPGSRLYVRYVIWSDREFANHFILTADPRKVLDEQTDVVFHGTSLHDVITYLREVHSCRIEFDPDVDTEQEITIVQQGTVRDVTQALLTPLGLAAAADRERILIGTPAALERAAAESRRSNSILYFTLAVLVVLTAITVVWWSRRNHKRPAA